jgi:hypothetical protein
LKKIQAPIVKLLTSYGYAMYRFSEKASGTTPRRLTRP